MRKTFTQELIRLAEKDPNVFLLTADLGYGYLEKFQKKFPRRYFNVGVAEQNMVGIATGLALSGKKVFVYSMATFLTMRCFEYIREFIAYGNLDVKLIGIGGRNKYPHLGISHNCPKDEDLKLMGMLMKVVAPKNKAEVKRVMRQLDNKPMYMRLF